MGQSARAGDLILKGSYSTAFSTLYCDSRVESLQARCLGVVITAADVQRLAHELFQPAAFAVTGLGNLKGFKFKRAQLVC